jgi:hypothetical protein
VTASRTFTFYARSAIECKSWVAAIRFNTDRVSRTARRTAPWTAVKPSGDAVRRVSKPLSASDQEEAHSIPAADIVLQGVLQKASGNTWTGKWQRRWFIVANGLASYYKSELSEKARGAIDLSQGMRIPAQARLCSVVII